MSGRNILMRGNEMLLAENVEFILPHNWCVQNLYLKPQIQRKIAQISIYWQGRMLRNLHKSLSEVYEVADWENS
jgi:hypothetical protein